MSQERLKKGFQLPHWLADNSDSEVQSRAVNAPMSAASTVSRNLRLHLGRLFHSFTILIKKECLKQLTLAGLTYNLNL